MELKDFDRITLAPGETKKVTFTLSPYDISLLNEQMDRVVEPGEFKIMVGGKSPSYKAQDRIKDSVGFLNASDGVNGTIDYTKAFAADFDISYSGMEENLVNNTKKASVKIKNKGNLNDFGKIYMFVDNLRSEELFHFELDPGEETTVSFELENKQAIKNLTFVTKHKSLTINQ